MGNWEERKEQYNILNEEARNLENMGALADEKDDHHNALKYKKEAIESWKKTLELNIGTPYNIYLNIGHLHCQLKDFTSAIENYGKANEINANYSSAYFYIGKVKSTLKNYVEAIESFDQGIAKLLAYDEYKSEKSQFYYSRAHAKAQLNNYLESVNDYSQAITFVNKGLTGLYGKSDLYPNEYKSAMPDFDAAIKAHPKNWNGYMLRGHARAQLKNYQDAIEDFNSSIDIDNNNYEVYQRRGEVYYLLGEYKLALKDLNKVYNQSGYFVRGCVKSKLQDYLGAKKDFDEALQGNIIGEHNGWYERDSEPINPQANYERAYARFKLHDYARAIEDCDTALMWFESESSRNLVYQLRGFSKLEIQDYSGAMADFNRAIETCSSRSDSAYSSRGKAKLKLQDYRGAIEDLNKAIEINPKNGENYFWRGQAKIYLNQKDNGCLDLSKAGELGYSDAYEAIKRNCN